MCEKLPFLGTEAEAEAGAEAEIATKPATEVCKHVFDMLRVAGYGTTIPRKKRQSL